MKQPPQWTAENHTHHRRGQYPGSCAACNSEVEERNAALYKLQRDGRLDNKMREAVTESEVQREGRVKWWLRGYRAASWIRRNVLRK